MKSRDSGPQENERRAPAQCVAQSDPDARPLRVAAVAERVRRTRSVAIYLPHISAGGTEISMVNLALGMQAEGVKVWIVVHQQGGELTGRHDGIDIVSLDVAHSVAALPGLIRFLRQHEPDVLLSALPHNNIIAAFARLLGRRETRLVVTEHAPVTILIDQANNVRYRILKFLIPPSYPMADRVVAVSTGVRDDLRDVLWRRSKKAHVIYNPVLPLDWCARAAMPIDDSWFASERGPLIVSAGRLSVEKDFRTLICAFAEVLTWRPELRLAILGTGPELAALQALVKDLAIDESVRLVGYVANPYAYMRHASLFVLPSRFEGFGNVLVEAMACGTPVISTDCPVGPREILRDGEFGVLVPVGDIGALAAAIRRTIDAPPDTGAATQHALQFTVGCAVKNYLSLFDTLLSHR